MRLVAAWEVKGLGREGGGVVWGAYESLRRIWGPYFNSDAQKLAYMVGAIRERKRGIASAERERKKGFSLPSFHASVSRFLFSPYSNPPPSLANNLLTFSSQNGTIH